MFVNMFFARSTYTISGMKRYIFLIAQGKTTESNFKFAILVGLHWTK